MHIDDLCRAVLDKVSLNHCDSAGDRPVGFAAALSIWSDDNEAIRIAPTLTPVDMSVLIDSGIDCEFSKGDKFSDRFHRIGKLKGTHNNLNGELETTYIGPNDMHYAACRPRQDYWHAWKNSKHIAAMSLGTAGFLIDFDHTNSCFKFTGIQPNRCYPWEAS